MTLDMLHAHWPLPEEPEALRALTDAYGAPERAYHNELHLLEMFTHLEAIIQEEPVTDHELTILKLAIWFHDSVYDSQGENERRSARLVRRLLPSLSDPVILEVERLILLTETHRLEGLDVMGAILLDCDLGILAEPTARYSAYTAAVRSEYSVYSDEDFTRGRITILENLLAKPELLLTAWGKRKEPQARANVEAELEALRATLNR